MDESYCLELLINQIDNENMRAKVKFGQRNCIPRKPNFILIFDSIKNEGILLVYCI